MPQAALDRQGGTSISIALHIWQTCLALLVVLAPVPASLACLAEAEQAREGRSLGRSWMVLLLAWCALGSAVGIGLGILGLFRLTGLLLAMAVLLAAGVAWRRRQRRLGGPTPRDLLWPASTPPLGDLLVFGAAAALGASLFLWLLREPITEYDSLAYHLPAMARWLQTGFLARLEQYPLLSSRYPYSWEALCALLLLPFHEDFLVALPNLAAWALFGLAIYTLAREVGAHRTAALAVALASLGMPDVLANVPTMHVDLPFAAFFLTGSCCLLRYLRSGSRAYLGLFLLALGMMAGAKSSGFLYGALLLAILIGGRLLRRRPVPAGTRRGLAVLVLGALGALLVGGFWYARNWAEDGNPLAPLRVQVGHHVIFPGVFTAERARNSSLTGLFHLRDGTHWRILAREVGEHLGLPFALVGLLALVGLGASLPRGRPPRGMMLGLFLLVGATAYLYAATPFSADNYQHGVQVTAWMGQALRYALPCCGILAVAAAVGAGLLRLPAWLLRGLSVATVLPGLDPRALLVLLGAMGGWWIALRWLARARLSRWRWAVALAGAGLPMLFVGTYVARVPRAGERVRHYGGIVEAVETQVAAHEAIGFLKSDRAYLLYGRNLDRRLYYIAAPRKDARWWRTYAHDHGIRVVSAGPPSARGPKPDLVRWLDSAEGPFVRVFGDPALEPALYRLKREVPPAR